MAWSSGHTFSCTINSLSCFANISVLSKQGILVRVCRFLSGTIPNRNYFSLNHACWDNPKPLWSHKCELRVFTLLHKSIWHKLINRQDSFYFKSRIHYWLILTGFTIRWDYGMIYNNRKNWQGADKILCQRKRPLLIL